MSLSSDPLESVPASHRLPNEITRIIFTLLERSQLPCISQINKAQRHEIYPSLYENIFMSIYGDTSGHPTSFIAEEDEELPGIEPAVAMGGAINLSLRHISLLTSPIYRQPLEDRFTFVSRLCLNTHTNDPTSCLGYRPIIMPNLDTLRFIPLPNTNLPEILDVSGQSRMMFDWVYLVDDPASHPECPLLSLLRPKQVLIGGPSTTLTGDGAGLWKENGRFPPHWLKELVVFIGRVILVHGRSFLVGLPHTIERLTLVFEPLEELSKLWEWADFHGQDDDLAPYTPGDEVIYIFRRLAEICRGMAGHVDIVGLDDVDLEAMGFDESEEAEEVVRECIFTACIEAGTSEDVAGRTAEKIRFLTRDQWLDRQTYISWA